MTRAALSRWRYSCRNYLPIPISRVLQKSAGRVACCPRSTRREPFCCSFEADLFCRRVACTYLAAPSLRRLAMTSSRCVLRPRPFRRLEDWTPRRSGPSSRYRSTHVAATSRTVLQRMMAELMCVCFIDVEWWRCGRLPSMKPVNSINSFGGSVPVRATCHILLLRPTACRPSRERALRPVLRVMDALNAHMPVVVEAQ